MLDQIEVSLDVVVAADDVLRLCQKRRFDNQVVLGVAALVERTARDDDMCPLRQEAQEFGDLFGRDGILAGDARAGENVADLFEQRQLYGYRETVCIPVLQEAGWLSTRVDER